jgi:hypothetical protein
MTTTADKYDDRFLNPNNLYAYFNGIGECYIRHTLSKGNHIAVYMVGKFSLFRQDIEKIEQEFDCTFTEITNARLNLEEDKPIEIVTEIIFKGNNPTETQGIPIYADLRA